MIVTQHSGEEGGGRREHFVKNSDQPGAAGRDLLSLTMTLFVGARRARSFSKHQKENLEELLKLFI